MPSSSGRRLAKRSSWSSILSRLIHSGLRLMATSSRRARAAIAFASACRRSTSSASSRSLTADCVQRRPLVMSSSSSPRSCSLLRERACESPTFLPHELSSRSRVPVEHVDHVVERDAIQARREPVQPLGGGRVAERVELLHFAEADGEDVDVRRLVDVLERLAQQAVALLFAVGGGDRDFADVGRAAVGVAADRERAVVGFDFEPTAGPAADDRRQVSLAPRAATRRTAPSA